MSEPCWLNEDCIAGNHHDGDCRFPSSGDHHHAERAWIIRVGATCFVLAFALGFLAAFLAVAIA